MQYGVIVSIFSCAYAVGLLLAGNVIDRIGTRRGYALAATIWSVAAMSHFLVTVPAITHTLSSAAQFLSRTLIHVPVIGNAAWVRDIGMVSGAVIGFGLVRFLLGLGEAGNFPAAVKTTRRGLPRKRALVRHRYLQLGHQHRPHRHALRRRIRASVRFGCSYAFLITGLFSLIWLVTWLRVYTTPQDNTHVSRAELDFINSDPVEPASKIVWSHLIPHRQTWAFLCGKLLTDPIWWFYLFWLPGYLFNRYGLSITRMGLPLLIIYNVCTIGSIFGGWLPTKFISLGWSQNRARKTAMLLYACGIAPIMFISRAPNIWVAIAMISVATALHQAWSCNLFTLPSDMFPRRAVASVVGIGAFGGAMGMMFFGMLHRFPSSTLTHTTALPAHLPRWPAPPTSSPSWSFTCIAPKLAPANVSTSERFRFRQSFHNPTHRTPICVREAYPK